jgi:hypothetical protein
MSAWRRIRAAMAIACAAGLAGCVGLQQYNRAPDEYLREVRDPDTGATADLCIIEFDDEGEFWDIDQLRGALETIRRRNAESPDGIVVPVFIHGWKNNADWSRERGDLRRVAREVAKSAAQLQRAPTGHLNRVVGVFIGWRGDVAKGKWSRQLSFWNRLLAADRVASLNLKESLHRIVYEAKLNPESRVVLYGHSMGGRILFTAMSQALVKGASEDGFVGQALPVDLVVLANPANRAVDVARFVDMLKRYRVRRVVEGPGGAPVTANGPLIASITSEADTATGRAFPFGQGIVRLFRSYRTSASPDAPSQGWLAAHTDGHTDFLLSHRASVRDGRVVLDEIPARYNDTPFWVIRTTAEICANHGDIANPRMNELIGLLLETCETYTGGRRPHLISDADGLDPEGR